MNARECHICGHHLIPGKMRCESCKSYTPDGCTFASSGTTPTKLKTRTLKEVRESRGTTPVKRLKTGPWDKIFGSNWKTGESGMVVGSSNLLGGPPGVGKSTLLLGMADRAVEETGLQTLYVAAEEQLEQIDERAERMDIKNLDRIRFVEAMTGEAEIGAILQALIFGFLIVDSITAIAMNNPLLEVAIAHAVKIHLNTMKSKCPAVLISQVNKNDDFSGLQKLQHEVDGTFHFMKTDIYVPGNPEPIRGIMPEKNRNGQAGFEMQFEMTEKGLILFDDGENEESDEEE